MHASTTRTFTPARIVALALIALLVVGLGYLRFAPDSGSVSVPAGAEAGDLVLEDCDYATEAGAYRADCGTLVVPENRRDPESRLIALPVTRIHARSADAKEPIFRLEGGPGVTNMKFENASRFAESHDVVLVGYRGVDGSSVLDCPEVESALKHSTDFLGEKSFRAYESAFRACADRLTDDGTDIGGYTLAQRVDDFEAARVALGYDRIDLLSESAGTRAAMIYSWRYPKSIHRSVIVAANPPGNWIWDAKTTDEQVRRYVELCEQDDSCSKRTDDLAASLKRTDADFPSSWMGLPIKEGNVRTASFWGLMETSSDSTILAAPLTLGSWLSADDGDASGFWFQSLVADITFPQSFVWGDVAAAAKHDTRAAKEYFSSGERGRGTILGDPGTEFLWAGGRMLDAWPAAPGENEYSRMRTSTVPTLVISGELDIATPPQNATRQLMPHLPNGHQVVLEGFGHTIDFWTQQPEAGTRLVNTFLDTGRVDDSLYEPATVDFTPEVSYAALGKGFAGTMAGLALLTILSLLVMARRVRRRGGFGRKASALLRSVYPFVLGLGGWFLGVLVVVTTMPGTPVDHEVLAALSVGLPVGLGIYLAWVRRDRPEQSKGVGLAAAVAGGLVGAWLGFHATTDLLALVTAIAGAIAGANLTLILLDVSGARSASEAPAARGVNVNPAASG
jgi:pimeloyl-ACP methyl ester carboxylesterase